MVLRPHGTVFSFFHAAQPAHHAARQPRPTWVRPGTTRPLGLTPIPRTNDAWRWVRYHGAMELPVLDGSQSCASCGFLSIRTSYDDEAHEVKSGRRSTGKMYVWPTRGHGPEHVVPGCFRGERPFDEPAYGQALKALQSRNDLPNAEATYAIAIEVINRPRSCSKWFRYSEGRSPNQHMEDYLRRELESDRRSYEDRMAEREKRVAKRQWWITAVFGFIGALATLAITAATITQDSLLGQWIGFKPDQRQPASPEPLPSAATQPLSPAIRPVPSSP